ncbi:hypothetical protein LZK98_13460 [Sphingomonas cannabina]|uniref:hypothetical protein n=1 Tax=Sphingomonas cannabina TaxID=2899123 RepID=UPI001F421709|nr:hypothetical protein [Sphingomonas cannabina]UIJ44082.1 hypothetical protein LZK98_13460 [Sphingomonas cannabina]
MKTSASVGLGALALALAAGAGFASSRQNAPESILPPGFNEPAAPAPTPAPGPAPASRPAQPGTPAPAPAVAPPPVELLPPGAVPTPTPTPTATPTPVDLSAYELPAYAKRPLNQLGAIGPNSGGVDLNAFGRANGRTIELLMRRLDAPLPSRWLSIALRRALASRLAPPPGVNGADFAAERAWLLLRMGEADVARAVVQSVDTEDYTPKLFQVAMQAMLATGDPAGLCPLAEPASGVSNERGWAFAKAMCSALAGKPREAGQQLQSARRGMGRTLDALLAEKVVGAGGGRSVTIEPTEWNGVDRLTIWRYGLATATGVEIPAELFGTVGAQVASWRATSPMIEPADRVGVADMAAAQGVLSSLALADLYGEIAAGGESTSAAGARANDLQTAFTGATPEERIGALRQIWDSGETVRERFARLILTARAAARVAPAQDLAGDSDRLVASMLTGGLDTMAARWRGVAQRAGDAWAMIALTDPRGGRVRPGDVEDYRSGDQDAERLKARMLLAGLAGLGRLSEDEAQRLGRSFDVRFGLENSWTRAIEAAAARGEAGTVLLLAGVGMQTTSWRGVPPEVLFHSVAALRAVGLEGEARMIAAEAIARL